MNKKILITIFGLSFIFLFSVQSTHADTNKVNVYLFYGNGCPHCAKERQFLSNVLTKKYPDLNLYEYEIYYDNSNVSLFKKVLTKLKSDSSGVPFLIIGDEYFVGYSDNISPIEIEKRVKQCLVENCLDSVASIVGVNSGSNISINENTTVQSKDQKGEKIINIPFIGKVDALKYSLPALTIIIGLLDGFNPCAMWTLLFLISLLLGMKDRKRMWILGITFIMASASVYFIFMAAWLNLILFLGFVIWIRILIGILALIGGGYSLKEFIFNKKSGCKVTGSEDRQKVFERLKSVVKQNNLWLALGGIIILAFAVNLVELICSAGLPAVYTQVLALNGLSSLQYYLYILLYVFFFMLDDLFVFFVAMYTLEMTGITTKYARVSRLVGGIIMLFIGILLIFKPELLMFG
jgi:glutaredoxin